MTMTINQQFIDLARSAWMDTETRSFYLDKFSPETADYDDFVGEVMGRNLDTLCETYAAIGRDFTSELIEWGGTGVSDSILFLWEEDDLPFLMMMWDMVADGWMGTGSDSIGRMEDYEVEACE